MPGFNFGNYEYSVCEHWKYEDIYFNGNLFLTADDNKAITHKMLKSDSGITDMDSLYYYYENDYITESTYLFLLDKVEANPITANETNTIKITD